MEIVLISFYLIWFGIFLSGLLYWIPKYVPKEYQDETIHFFSLGFVFITVSTRFIKKIVDGTLTSISFFLYILSLAVFIFIIIMVYYLEPFNVVKFEIEPSILFAIYSMTLVLINLYEQEITESAYKVGETLQDIGLFGGKRKTR